MKNSNFPDILKERFWEAGRWYISKDDDVILASIPRSGWNWLKLMASLTLDEYYGYASELHFDGQARDFHYNRRYFIPLFYRKNRTIKNEFFFNNNNFPRLLHIHWPVNKESFSRLSLFCLLRGKTVVLVRNIFDAVISHYYHRKFHIKYQNGHFNTEALLALLRRYVMFFNFWGKVVEKRGMDSCMVLRYEELKEDTLTQLKSFFDFVGIENIPDNLIIESINKARFDRLKAMEKEAMGIKDERNLVRARTGGTDYINELDEGQKKLCMDFVNRNLKHLLGYDYS